MLVIRMVGVMCAVIGCSNSHRKLKVWNDTLCATHKCHQGRGTCTCPAPYQMLAFPKVESVKLEWEKLVNRTENMTRTVKYHSHVVVHKRGERWAASPYDRICSKHFVDGRPTPENPYPTVDMGYTITPIKPKRKTPTPRKFIATKKPRPSFTLPDSDILENDLVVGRLSDDSNDELGDNSPSIIKDHSYCMLRCKCGGECCDDKQLTINRLEKRVRELEGLVKEQEGTNRTVTHKAVVEVESKGFDIDMYLKNDKQVHFYTGLPTVKHFELIYNYMYDKVKKMPYWRGDKRVVANPLHRHRAGYKKTGRPRKLSIKAELLLVLMKLRLGLLNHDLADRFEVSHTTVSSIFITWVKVLAKSLKFLIFWADKVSVRDNLPKCMQQLYPNVRATIDCTEFFIDRPRDLTLQAQTWSDYKHHNTVKALVAISPRGNISFVSEAWGGRSTDREITLKSGILDHVDPKDQWLADRGFLIKGEMLQRGAELVVPPAGKGFEQMSSDDVKKTKKIANVRIHVERAIERIKRFRFLRNQIMLQHLAIFDDILVLCAALSNLDNALVK